MIKEKNIFMTKLWDLLTDKIGSGWKEKYEKEKKKSQELENEMILIKGITVHNSPEMRAAKKRIEELETKLSLLNDPETTLKKARESGL